MPSDFSDLSDAYEAMIDWPRRLGHEEPFYRGIFREASANHVLDAACGTGHHAAAFHSWGAAVQGADISEAMIAKCQARWGHHIGLDWVVRGYDQPVKSAEPFDVAICIGNSLALAPDEATVAQAIRQLVSALRPGGLLVTHVLNIWSMPDGPVQWQKCRRAILPAGDSLVTKGVHRCNDRGYVDIVVTGLDDPQMRTESVPFLGLTQQAFAQMATAAGAAETRFLGGYRQQPYAPAHSTDLIMVARRAQL